MRAFLRARWNSLIFRLLFYFLLSILALAAVLSISFVQRIKPHVQNEILPNVERYVEYLIADIGNPPDLAVAQRLADELPFELRIEGQGTDWSSTPGLRPIAAHQLRPAPAPYANVYIGHHRRDEYLLVEKAGYRYLFRVDSGFRRGAERRHWLLFAALGAILFALYLAIRRMFRPIGEISAQVEKIGAGDLEQTIAVRGGGELARLAAGINRMSRQIESMLEGKSGLLLALSHELRSPLTRMRVNVELLEEDGRKQELIDDLREMEELIAAILESERLSGRHAPLNLERGDLHALLEDMVAGHACGARIAASLAPLELAFDPLRIRLLLKNLLDNACRYSQPGDGPIELRLFSDGKRAVIEVEDHGSGIEREDIERLTEAFYRPDSARRRGTGGYGLGLYLCRLIAAAHGGRLRIESEPGAGTRVSVALPLDNS